MNPQFAAELLKALMLQAVAIATPILLTAMVIGLAVSLFQSVTSIQEQTLTFVPKALGILGLLDPPHALDAADPGGIRHRHDRKNAANGAVAPHDPGTHQRADGLFARQRHARGLSRFLRAEFSRPVAPGPRRPHGLPGQRHPARPGPGPGFLGVGRARWAWKSPSA